MSFFVHNVHLHMTNVNTTEDKRLTRPPAIMILVLNCCGQGNVWVRSCVCFFCVSSFFFLHTATFQPCVFEQRNKESIWSEPLNAPVWDTLALRSLFDAAGRWSESRPRAERGLIWYVRSHCHAGSHWVEDTPPPAPSLQPSSVTLTRGDGLIHFSCLHLHYISLQCSVITCGTKKAKRQADFGDKLSDQRALSRELLGRSWRSRSKGHFVGGYLREEAEIWIGELPSLHSPLNPQFH